MEFAGSIVIFVVAAAATATLGMAFRWVDRKVTARVQWRVGPPITQPFWDVLKLMGKENLMPVTARGTGFLLAPIVAVASTAVVAAVLWRAVLQPDTAFMGDLIVVIYLLTIPAIMTIVGASASGNPSAAVGASREMKLLLSYELPLFVAILTAVSRGGWTFQLGGLLTAQHAGAPVVWSVSGALAFLIAIVCMQAKLGQVPFDLAEAECEIQSGVFVEYSGPSLAMFLLARMMLLALMPLLLIVVFWGGLYADPVSGSVPWWAWLSFLGKYVLLVALVTLIRNTNPRLRIDQTLRFFWFRLTPLAIGAAILALVGREKGLPWL